jgi:acetylglutamate kinase
MIVQKFGGTSVGSVERIHHVADKIIAARQQGHDVVVVLSAMNGETDRLIQLAKAVHPEPNSREYDMLVSTGEQVSISMLCIALLARGCQARSFTGTQAGIRTDSAHKKARIMHIDPSRLQKELAEGRVPVVAGFQGFDEHGNITTLGRGGSDTTAVALAASLMAHECQIYTDVDGVYTTDPRVVTPGSIYGDGYHELQSHCLAYVHATEVGGTHPALIEAMGAGNCVLAYDTPENREVVGDCGMFFSDVTTLAERMRYTLSNPAEASDQLSRSLSASANSAVVWA